MIKEHLFHLIFTILHDYSFHFCIGPVVQACKSCGIRIPTLCLGVYVLEPEGVSEDENQESKNLKIESAKSEGIAIYLFDSIPVSVLAEDSCIYYGAKVRLPPLLGKK